MVSVILPTYNRAHLVGRAIQTVLSQTYRDFELLVVDDASTDRTESVVKAFNDPRLKYLRHEGNAGGAAARNTGIKEAGGAYIAFQDSDDEWFVDKLQKQIDIFDADPEAILVYCGLLFWTGERAQYEPLRKIKKKNGWMLEILLKDNPCIGTQLLVIKREALVAAGMFFDESLKRLQDWELLLRLANVGPFRFIDEPLVKVNISPDSLTRVDLNRALSLEHIMAKHPGYFREPAIRAKHCGTIGHYLCVTGDIAGGRKWLLESVKLDPWQTKSWLALLVALTGKTGYRLISEELLAVWRKVRRW